MTVDVVDGLTGELKRASLDFDALNNACEIRLELAPGASSLQVVAREEDKVVSWIEVPAQAGEQVCVEFRRDGDTHIRGFSRNKPFLILPAEEPPAPRLIRPATTEELDLVVLVDGTCLHPTIDPTAGLAYLLAPELRDVWKKMADDIARFVSQLSARYPRLWATVLAFGDEPIATVANDLLKPSYLIYPPLPVNRKPQELTAAQLAELLVKIPFTAGGDFVDGLADGLHACAQVPWRQNSRKLLLLLGQSPGYSVLEACDDMTDFLIRKACVEEESAALHQKGIEVATVFHLPVATEERYSAQLPDVLRRAREQYRTLASLTEWSCAETGKELADLGAHWLSPPAFLARGPSPGVIAAAPGSM